MDRPQHALQEELTEFADELNMVGMEERTERNKNKKQKNSVWAWTAEWITRSYVE